VIVYWLFSERNRIIDNPYAASNIPQTGSTIGISGFEPRISASILFQIRVVAILLIVHGALLLIMGGFLIAISIVMPSMIAAQQQKMQQAPNGPSPAQLQNILFATYMGMGSAGIVPGIIQIIAGIRNFRLHGRIFGIVALVAGVLSIGTCYCAPTSVALMVYGLIIYLNNTSTQVFSLAQQGLKWSDIEKMTRQ
jgi:hypothetical protein